MKTSHHPNPMEGLWLGAAMCAPFWAVILLLVLR